ncbi:DUF4241 domain-containing protein [Streptomyces nojiriensis]|uniref:DUF4241 domain-containing protein n=1 Tax=Streptomyces nojiriensis TaxID=66374 RepID=UPI003650E420
MTDTIADVTTIRVPSGRLIVDSPWSENHGREMVARIPPGTYRVEAAWTEAPYEHGGEYFDGRECAATRLRVSDDPVVVWEAGGGVDDDIGDADVAAAGFHSDSEATGAIADAEAWEALTAPFHRFRRVTAPWGTTPAPDRDTEDLCGGWFEKSSNEGFKADLIAFDVAEGWAPVWIGRTGPAPWPRSSCQARWPPAPWPEHRGCPGIPLRPSGGCPPARRVLP